MYSKLYSIYILLFVGSLELPTAVMYKDEENYSHELTKSGWEVRCKLQPNTFSCYKDKKTVNYRFYYDIVMQSCKTFGYGGCALSYNRFTTLSDCSSLCTNAGEQELTAELMKGLSMETICRLQYDFGTCFEYHQMYYYDVSTRTCKSFAYSGCNGNDNRFATHHECLVNCASTIPEYKLVSPK